MSLHKYCIGLLLCTLGISKFSVAQQFSVSFNPPGYDCQADGAWAGHSYAGYSRDTYGRPTGWSASYTCITDAFDQNGNPVTYTTSYSDNGLPDVDCYSDANISWRPYNMTKPGPGGAICLSNSITLTAPLAYHSYQWQYSISTTSGFQSLKTTTSNSITVAYSELPGIAINQDVYFRYVVCGFSSVVSGSYRFGPDQIKFTSYSSTPPTCINGDDGSATFTLSRNLYSWESLSSFEFQGTTAFKFPNPSFTYNSSSNNTQVVLTGSSSYPLPSGTFSSVFIANNSNYCGTIDLSQSFSVGSGPHYPVSATVSVTSNYNGSQLSCNGASDGEITVSALSGNNGNGFFQYSLDGTNFYPSSPTTATKYVFTGGAGNYNNIKVRDGCSTPSTSSVNPVTIVAPAAVSISSLTPSFCNAASNGQITVSASGGTGTLSYSKDGITFLGSNVFTGLTTGTSYTITVKDQNNCSTSSSVLVPGQLTSGTTSVTHPTCSGSALGSISISGSSGGTAPLTWSIGGAYQSVSTAFTNVSPGTYSVIVSDAKGCTASAGSVTINQPITASYSTTLASCATVNDGTITVTGTAGGTGTYSYSLDGTTYQGSNVFSGKAGGSYKIYVKDANGCVLQISSVTVGLKPAVTGTITQTSFINCFGDATAAFNVVSSGGTPLYISYSWSNGASGTSVSGVGAGTYTVTITDSKGCQGSKSILVTQPTQVGGSMSASNYNGFNISCRGGNNGAINLTPSGGTPFSGGTYKYLWSTGATTQNISGLSAGSYSVTITDANSCSTIKNITLTEPAASVSAVLQSKSDVTCFGANNGVISVTGSGGTGALSYSKDGVNYQLGSTFASLAAGSYTITAKDANACSATTPVITITTPTALTISSITNNPLCNGSSTGSLVVTAAGGTTSYQYSKDGSNFSSSNTLSGLTAGSYVVTVKDGNGCTKSSSAQALIDPAALTVTATGTPESFAFAHDGKIDVVASGGTGAKSYSIDGINFQSGASFSSLGSGAYTVTVKDQNNCVQTTSVAVASSPPPPSSTTCASGQQLSVSLANQADPTCGLANGSVDAVVVGGSGTFGFQWFDNLGQAVGSNATLPSVPSGIYNVRVTDTNHCVVGISVTFAPYAWAQFNVTNVGSTLCSNSTDGSATAQVSSVQGPYTLLWSSGETTVNATKLVAGQNTVTITDVNHCQVTETVQVPSPPAISILTETIVTPVCVGGPGSIQVTPTGGAGNFTYVWNGTVGQSNIQNIKAGTYNLLVKDGSGCSFTKAYTLNDPPAFTIDLGIDEVICPNTTTTLGMTLLNATYVWSGPNNFSSTQGVVNVGEAGKYTLTVTNSDGCMASDDLSVTISNNLLKADLLGVSQAHVADTIILVDISWPAPDKIEWHLSDSANVIYTDKDYALISFSKPGVYQVGVSATLGGCENEYFQKIVIDDQPLGGESGTGSGTMEIVSLTAYPNPFESKTNAEIELSQPGGITVKVYSLVTNLLIMQKEFVGDAKYDVELDFSTELAGLYIIIVESGSKTKAVRVIKL